MAQAAWPVVERRFGQTRRRDAWWVQPLVTFLGLSAFVVYSTWAAFQGNHYEFGPYLSPFYSPLLFGDGAALVVRAAAGLVARRAAVLCRAADPLGARRLPLHLLLLSGRLLQGLLGGSTVVHRRRTAQAVPRRALVPADPPERPSLFPLPGADLHRDPRLRRVEGDVVRRA